MQSSPPNTGAWDINARDVIRSIHQTGNHNHTQLGEGLSFSEQSDGWGWTTKIRAQLTYQDLAKCWPIQGSTNWWVTSHLLYWKYWNMSLTECTAAVRWRMS